MLLAPTTLQTPKCDTHTRDDMDGMPSGAHPWSVNPSVAKIQRRNILNAGFFTIAGFFVLLASFKVLQILSISHIVTQLAISLATAIVLWKHYLRISRVSELLTLVAIGDGHPWHPSEEVGEATVWVSDGERFHRIPDGARLYAMRDPILERTLLKKNDSEGVVLFHWPYTLDYQVRKMVSLVNQALALRDAQNRRVGEDDEIEKARNRESGEFYPRERKWLETTDGSMTPKPGVLLRGWSEEGEDSHPNALRDILDGED